MPLLDLDLPADRGDVPGDLRSFLKEADRRIRRFLRRCRAPGFLPSDFTRAYRLLRAVAEADLAPGNLFCEWGSGFGVVACLAALLDFDACGIEVNADLVDAARRLAADFGLPVAFAQGSFIPRGDPAGAEAGDGFAWLATDGGDAHEELGLAADDFDVVFAYPWPDEEGLTAALFERHARPGALLLTYHGEGFRLRRRPAAPAGAGT